VRCGIGRPENKDDVAGYVLSNFAEGEIAVEKMIQEAQSEILKLI